MLRKSTLLTTYTMEGMIQPKLGNFNLSTKSETRWRDCQISSGLDFVFTNEEFLADNLSILASLGKNNHTILF